MARAVVARVAPPPAPPTFQSKLAVIRENQGAPVAAAQAAKISVENRGRPQAITNVRPVTAEAGRVTLAPRTGVAGAQARKMEPVSAQPVRGRPIATTSQPVSAAPITSNVRGATGAPGTGRNPPSIERGTVQGGNPKTGETGKTQTLERGNPPLGRAPVTSAPVINDSGRGRQPKVESRQFRPTPGGSGVGGPPPQPTARTLQRQENVVPRNDRIARPTPSTNRGNQPVLREAQPQTRERVVERPTPPPRPNTSGAGTSNQGARGRDRQVVTPEPQGRTQSEVQGRPQVQSQPQRVERGGNPKSPEGKTGGPQAGDRGRKEEKPKPEKTPKK